MAELARVTVIGNLQPYLQVRADVLVNFWQVKTVALDLGQIPTFDADLIVFCASIPESEQQQWVKRARQEAPLVLIVRMSVFDSGPLMGADATVDDDKGPGPLVSTIYELLTERGLESREWPEPLEGGWVQ